VPVLAMPISNTLLSGININVDSVLNWSIMAVSSVSEVLALLEAIKMFLLTSHPGTGVTTDELQALLQGGEWPLAVPERLLCRSEADKIERAKRILDYFVDFDLTGKKFLDFGCGEGHVVAEAKKNAEFAIGYDHKSHVIWRDRSVTDDFTRIVTEGPYDVILLYDVIDHAEHPEELIKQVRSLCHLQTKVYCRCHPWCSRHGGHHYDSINKAFLHLVLTPDELQQLGIQSSVQQLIHPMVSYGKWFKNSFSFRPPLISREPVEDFFKRPILKERIARHWKKADWSDSQLSQSYVDFVLTPL
jgi:hypothetical protein